MLDLEMLSKVVDLFKGGGVRRIVVLSGAGISTAASIPDFRSPGGGFYASLRPELLTCDESDRAIMKEEPTWVVNKDLFMRNAFPYLEVRRQFIVNIAKGADSPYKPTAFHFLIELFHRHKLLVRHFEQNIDALSHKTQVPHEKLVQVHGTLARVSCEACGADGPGDGSLQAFAPLVRTHIKNIYEEHAPDELAPKESKPIRCEHCGKAALKPSTVLFGGALPSRYFECIESDVGDQSDPEHTLCIVAGTSLQVQPAAMMPSLLPRTAKIVVMNREPLDAHIHSGHRVFAHLGGSCDEAAIRLAFGLGWLPMLEQIASEGKMAEGSVEMLKKLKLEFEEGHKSAAA
eukprot:Hpha_TRINITY_DN15857_c0_g1::TRINITY_DN15857_c0_g1_i1::g.190607::m.190607